MFLILAFIFSPFAGRFALAQEAESVQEPAAAPAPDPAPVPASEPTPVPEPTPTTEPTSEPVLTPEPVSEPTSEPATEPTPEPALAPESTIVTEPAPTIEPTPTSTPTSPESAPTPIIEEPALIEELNAGIIFETSTPTPNSLPGYFESRQVQVEQKEETGKPAPVFWQIFYHNPNGTEIQITDSGYDNMQFQPRGTKAVWKAYPNSGHAEIFFYDAETREKKQISINNSSNDDPVLTDDGRVVWRGWDTSLGTWNIYFYNGSETVRVSNTREGALWPSISGDVIAWQEKSGGVWQIMAYNISTHRPWLITGDSHNNENPQTDGRNIVWQKEIGQDQHDIFLYDLKTERLWNLSKKDFGDKVLPRIENKKIAWFKKSSEPENIDFEETDWNEKNVEELTAVKPTSVEETAAVAANNIPIENSPEDSDDNNIVPIEEPSASTSPPILIPPLVVSAVEPTATTTEEIVLEQSVIIDVSNTIEEQASPTTTVSLTEPAPEPISEISLPPAPESTELITIPVQ